MEGPKSASLGAMGSLLRKLAELPGMEDRALQLREDLVSINTKLMKLSEVDDPSATVNYWMKDVRELSYDMEDCVDQFIHDNDLDDNKMSLVDNLLRFETRVAEVGERYDSYKLEYGLSYPTTSITHRFRKACWEPRDVVPVGMEIPTNELRRLVEPKSDDENDLQLKVVSILGVEGVGKSMLSQKLFHELREQFECQAFVQTAKKPDMRMILRSILSQICLQQASEPCQVPNLIHDIRRCLQEKRYFIIIDDLWAVPVWDILSRSFPEGNRCSRIVITTTIEDVALACCSYDPQHIFWMKPLGPDHSNQLFISRSFGTGKGYPQQFNDVLDGITQKCCGLPLAILCMACLVASQPEEQWAFLRKSLYQNLKTNSSFAEILKQVLKLCYNSLPHCLKTCLLYLSVYPENYLFVKDDLVSQWVAEGFICATKERDNIEVASSYFDELISLGLIQRMNISNHKKKRLTYVVHPFVFYFITSKSMEDNFITTIDYSHQSTAVLQEKNRRLALHFGSATYATIPAGAELSQVRSLVFIGLLGCIPSIVDFKLVRVMVLHLQGDNGDKMFSLTEICKLFLLRYLQVRSNVIVELPAQVQCLELLETLKINAEVAIVPSDIFHHPKLLHVHVGTKRKLKHVTLGPVTSAKAIFRRFLTSAPSPAVQMIKLVPPIYSFSRLPGWTQLLHGLRILEVVVGELWAHDVHHIARLPVLKAISLYVRKPDAKRVVTFRGGAFPALEYLKLVSGMLVLSFREEAVPNLQRLKIGFNVHREHRYKHMLGGIQHLLKLKEVVASIGVVTDAGSDYIAAKCALQSTIDKHPCRPKLNWKRLVDPIEEEYEHPTIHWKWERQSSNIYGDSSIEQPGTSGIQPAKDSSGTKPPPSGDKDSAASSIPPSSAPWRQSQNKVWRRPGPAGNKEVMLTALFASMHPLLAELNVLMYPEDELLSSLRGDIYSFSNELMRMLRELFSSLRGNSQPFNYFDEQIMDSFIRYGEVIYELEDWADLLVLHNPGGRGNSSEFAMYMVPLHHKLRDLSGQILGSHQYSYNSHSTVPRPVKPHGSPIGQDGPMAEVIRMCVNTSDMAEFKIISIIGMAGSGKTTLAESVYHQVRDKFDCSVFVSIAQEWDRERQILEYILRDLGIMDHQGTEDITQLTRKLREFLENKRYLIVLDDLWRAEQLEAIKFRFSDDNLHSLHSRVIITTRNDALALLCSSYATNPIYKIGLLSDEDSEKLFLRELSDYGHSYPQHLKDFTAQIMRKCAGLPLAVVSVAAMLTHDQSEDKWRMHGLNLLSSLDANHMMQSLNRSYNNLPPILKTCMLYLSIFPEYYEVNVERLVRLWIAEGSIIIDATGKTMEETARSYLDGLISRNMVLPLYVNHDDIPKCCMVHPVIHDFIVYKAREQNFVAIVSDKSHHQDAATGSSIIRRLSLQSSSKKDQNMARSGAMDLSHARSITVFGQASTVPHLTGLRILRVLDLEGFNGMVCLDDLHKLLLLRYLSLRGTSVSDLPETIGELRYLQTLDVRSTNVKELPASIVMLEKLMHLLCGCAKLPSGISKMKALQTLSCAIVTNISTSIIQELIELVDLTELELFCDFTPIPWDENVHLEHLLRLKRVHLEFAKHDAVAVAMIQAFVIHAGTKAAGLNRPYHLEVTANVDGRPLDFTII